MNAEGVAEYDGQNALWHPFATMSSVSESRFTLDRAEGPWVWDRDGRRYLDATAALWYSNLGHSRPEIAEAVDRQLRRLDAYSIFGDYSNGPATELAERLSELAPTPGSKVFLGTGGGEMVDTAAKLARAYHAERGENARVHLIGRTHGYHGTNGFGTSIGGIAANRSGYGPLLSDTSSVAFDDADDLEREIQRLGPATVAAFFCEPVIGAGGVRLPPDGYIEAVADICKRHGVLFVADSVICAFGRLGTWFGIDRWNVTPDMVVLAKGLSNGAQPVGALLVSPGVAEPFYRPSGPIFRHGATYAGHPTCCAAALVTLDLYEKEGVISRGRDLEGVLADTLAPLASSPLVAEVRSGLGFLAGIELRQEILAADPGAPGRWQLACREAGVLVRPLGGGVAVSPPLICAEEEIQQIGSGIAEGLRLFEAASPELAA